YTNEYWTSEGQPISVSISESKLEMPNAFSPNGDGINDIYRAKEGYRSLIEFKATIFNRWGQKLYSWTDPADGWDGKFNGKNVADGVYFVLVQAKGADGRKFNIKRDVNLLRGFTEGQTSPSLP
ncbi:MAG: gliding motility-associated C-terminal domain-containing protein, partial [Prevotella sp.]|nr:gliding motility-associated C-terminal domain-containing protein [Prevotella sp.]